MMNTRVVRRAGIASLLTAIVMVLLAVSEPAQAAGRKNSGKSQRVGVSPWATFPSSAAARRLKPTSVEYPNLTSHTLPHWDGLHARKETARYSTDDGATFPITNAIGATTGTVTNPSAAGANNRSSRTRFMVGVKSTSAAAINTRQAGARTTQVTGPPSTRIMSPRDHASGLPTGKRR